MNDPFGLSKDGGCRFQRDSIATFVNDRGELARAAAGVPRMDYDPDPTRADAAGCPPLRGLLLEPAIRNRLLWSSDLRAGCWFDAHRLRRDPEPTVAGPDAKVGDVISITDLSGHDWHHIGQWFPCRGSGRLTASIFVKATAEGSADFSIYAYGGHNLATFRRGDWAPIAGIAERTVVEKFRDGWVRVTAIYRALDHIYFGCAVGAAGSYEGRDEKQFYLYGPSLTAGAEPVSYVPTASAPATKACDVITLEDGAIAVPQVPVHVRRPKDIFEREELFDIIRPGRLIERLAAWAPLLKWTMDRLFEDADKLYAAADFEAELETYEKLVNLCVQIGEGSLVSEAAVRMARLKRNTHPESAVRRLVALKRTLLEMSLKLGGSGETKRALGILLASAPLNDYAAAAPVLEMVYGEGARDIAIIDVLSRAYLGTGNYDAALTVVRDYARSDVADEHKFKVFLDVLRLLDQTEPEKQRVYEELNAVGPASDDLFIHYALLCRCLGASAEALEHIRSARQSSRSAPLLAAMGLVLDDLNEGAASLNLLQEAERAADAPPYASKFTRSATRDLDHVRRMREYADSRASNCDKPKVAIMISGFVRDYHAAYALRSFVERHPGWAVDVFAHMFDRMGDFRIPFGMPKELYDYTNGGVFREIQKTAPLNTEKFMDFFQPTRCVIEERREDGYYNDLIGMAHPQWLKVFKCFELLENYISETGVRYDAAIRARPDTSYATLTLSPGKVSEGQVIVPGNHNYGMPGYTICDRFAYSTVNTIRTYCMIGAGKTFVALEKEDTWQQHLAAASHSHETHLAYWLMKNKIQVIRDLNLIV